MLLDALRWNMLNVIRVELFFNCYRIWNIFLASSLHSPSGQYAIVSLLISLVAQLAVQFDLGWLMSIYGIYLSVGVCVWLHRRVYFYHRKLDSVGVNQTIHHFDAAKAQSHHANGTLSRSDKSSASGGGSSSSSSSSALSATSQDGNTNSLQRQRASAYRDFQTLLVEPRRNHREFALSLAHLSNIAKLVADKDVFDEMHFQILATRRDVINLLLRTILLTAVIVLDRLR